VYNKQKKETIMASYKLPQKIKQQLAELPETGMGYQKTTLMFSDGRIIPDIIISNGEYFSTSEDLDMSKLKKIVIQKQNKGG
jgi:hypothetical protein